LLVLVLATPSHGAILHQDSPLFASASSIDEAQRILASLGYLRAGEYKGGRLDDDTLAAIRDFQRSHFLQVHGFLDPDTMAMLTSHETRRMMARGRMPGSAAPVAEEMASRGARPTGQNEGAGRGTQTSTYTRSSREMPATASPIPLLTGLGGLLSAAGLFLCRRKRA